MVFVRYPWREPRWRTGHVRRSPAWSRRVRAAGSLAVAIVALVVGAAGCWGGAAGSAASGNPPAAGGSSQSTTSARAVKYAQCMRSHGVTNFPDPVNGNIRLKVRKGSGLDPNSPQFKAAAKACKSLAPHGSATNNGQVQARMLKFAQCMRSHGLTNFPDPKNGRLLIKRGSGIDPNSPQFGAAQQACRKLLPGGGPGGGTS